MKRITTAILALALPFQLLLGQSNVEGKLNDLNLPEILKFTNGQKVKKNQWPERRQEILDIYQKEMYGVIPTPPATMVLETLEEGATLGAYATRRQVRMWFSEDKTGPEIDWMIITPNHVKGPVPTVLLLNFEGNHTLVSDKEVVLPESWMHAADNNHSASEADRGKFIDPNSRSIVPLNMLIAQGYAVVTACYADISPDPDTGTKDADGKELQNYLAYTGIFDLWGERDESRTDNTTALGAWSWGLMRGMDLIEKDPRLDAKRVVLTGCSRLAKAALIAGAFDERFPVVVLNQSGGGGAPLHKHYFGENVKTMTQMFKHWYCESYAKYVEKESEMPFDQHMLLSCIAPRALMIQGFNEPWFDTEGEFLALKAASPIWEFLGEEGLPQVEWPDTYDLSAVGRKLAYYRRDNLHGIAAFDWVQMIEFTEKLFGCSRNCREQ